ncbi:helix-turn-helix domain-containing protein [Streptomyces sp. NPDC052052]|uniref:helix-turn-helix domain-containing protein n=1 Tax=Streptomyces sp. NPDC052052 TaxID=3154756 RepID=UPI003418E717
MDTQQVSARPRATSPRRGDATPSSGVMHIHSRHTSRFTVVGNHLAQHRELSLLAIGLATHIQSLPTGANIGIKHLTERFPESEARIAAALHELEAHGYLRRTRERLPDGRIVTRTCSYNQPGSTDARHPAPASGRRSKPSRPAPARFVAPAPAPTPVAAPAPQAPEVPEVLEAPPAPEAPAFTAVATAPPAHPLAAPASPPHPTPPCVPARTAPKPPPSPLPHPREPLPQLLHVAAALLTDLHRHAPQLTLSEGDIHHLAPAVTAWLEREVTPSAIRHALTNDLPHPLKHPAKLLRHRLTALIPPPRIPRPAAAPLQNCDRCDHAFRSPTPGHCGPCAAAETQLSPA